MPYKKITDLPESVKDNLPHHAQEIYRAAFNSSWGEYDQPEERRGNATREETAHRIAWGAVKKSYEKKDDRWVEKDEREREKTT